MLHLVLPLFPKHVTNKTEDLYWLIIATGRVGQTLSSQTLHKYSFIHSFSLSCTITLNRSFSYYKVFLFYRPCNSIQLSCKTFWYLLLSQTRVFSLKFWNELFNLTKDKVGVLYSLEGLNSDRTVLPSWRDLYQGLLRGIGCVASSLRDYLRRGLLCLLPPICDHLLIYTIF